MNRNQVKTAIQVLSCYIFIALIVYLIASFTNWKLNPELWTAEARFGCAFATLLIGTFLMCIAGSKSN